MPKGERPTIDFLEPVALEKEPAELLYSAERELLGEALKSREGIEGLRVWRRLDSQGRGVRQMRKFLDKMAGLDRAVKKRPDLQDVIVAHSGEILRSLRSLRMTEAPRLGQLQALFLAEKLGEPLPKVHPEVKKIFDGLQKAKSTEGEVDVSDLLTSSAVAHGVKAQWFESQLLSAVQFLERRDLAEARQKAEAPPPEEVMKQKQEMPDLNIPPPERDSFAPSMEEMERAKEGEPGAWFSIAPFYGGYYREGDFERWNSRAMQWEREPRDLKEAGEAIIDEKTRRVVSGVVRGGGRTVLPRPYGFAPEVKTLSLRGSEATEAIPSIKVLEDGRGGYVLSARGEGLAAFSIEIGRGGKALTPTLSQRERELKIETGRLSDETEKALQEVKSSGRSAIEQARMLKQYVRRTLKYSNESAMNGVYRGGDPTGYFARIEQHKKADCGVANTYFLALLSRLEIPARMVTGHYVKVKDHTGAAVISSGTGHAWAEVWDGASWIRLDATPPGDPSMDEEEVDEKKEDEAFEGDFGEIETPEISDEELEKMMDEARKEFERKERAPEEERALSFAKDAGCSSEEAKVILKQIEAARETRDKQGRKIRDRLVREFQKIVQANSVERLRYKAPVRLIDGHELVDPVEAMLDIKAGEAEPTGFAKYERKREREQVYGGFDCVFVVDKSGSMTETDPVSGAPKWQEQQKFVFLNFDALNFTSQEFKRQKIRLISPMDVRIGLVSFQAGGAQAELPLGAVWGPKEQFKVWKALQENVGGGTPDHLGLGAAKTMIEEDIKKHPKEKNRLRLTLVSADGGSDNKSATMSAKESLKELGVVVKAAGIGPGAKEVKATYHPDGENLEGFDQVPDWAAEFVLAEAKKLYPKKVRK